MARREAMAGDDGGAAKAGAMAEEVLLLGEPPQLEPDTPFNPFRCDRQSFHGFYDPLRTILVLPLFLLRLLVLLVSLLLAYAFTKLALLGAKDALVKPFPPWRRRLFWPVRLLARMLLFCLGFQWISIKGKPAPRHLSPILLCNHVTFADPVFIFFKHLPVIVTAKENLSLPVVGAILRAMQVICVDRVAEGSRRIAAAEIKQRARCNDWAALMVFPEATTTNGKVLVSFKAGAFAPGYPVQPMVVRYPFVHLDPAWVALGASTPFLLFRLMTQLHNYMEVEYLPVIAPSLQEQSSPRAFAERVRTTMAKALNVMVTEHSYEDVALSLEALKSKDQTGNVVLEFGKFEKLFGLNIKQAKRYLAKFRLYNADRHGRVVFSDFQSWIELPNCAALQESFHLFDRPRRGHFNFRQYAAALAFISKHSRLTEAMQLMFTFCDRDRDGLLARQEFEESFRDLLPSISADQATRLWERIVSIHARFASKVELFSFLEIHPEFLIVFLFARSNLILVSTHEKDLNFVNINGKLFH